MAYKRRAKKKTKRTCLRCDEEFTSGGIYNRICPKCTKCTTTYMGEGIKAHSAMSAVEEF